MTRIGNMYLSAFLLGLAPPAFILAFGAALLYFLCYSPWRLNNWGGPLSIGIRVCTSHDSASTPMWAFMPKCQSLPFFV